MLNNFFCANRAVCDITWKNMVEPDRPQLTAIIWLILFACWIPKATHSHSEYVTLIAFLLQHWLHEGASVLRYTFSVCLV
jgi:hypothetical protein